MGDFTLTADTCPTCCVTINPSTQLLEHNTCTLEGVQRWLYEPVPGQPQWVRIRTVRGYRTQPLYWTVQASPAYNAAIDPNGRRLLVSTLNGASTAQQFKLLGGPSGIQIQIGNPLNVTSYCVDIFFAFGASGGVVWTYPCSSTYNKGQKFTPCECRERLLTAGLFRPVISGKLNEGHTIPALIMSMPWR